MSDGHGIQNCQKKYMEHVVYLHIPFKPEPQQRHRHAKNGRTYDPSSSKKEHFLELCRRMHHPPTPDVSSRPIFCTLTFTFARPRSHLTTTGCLRKGVPQQHVYKPDADNLAKFVMDSLNGVYYKDDSQICQLYVTKRYGEEDSVRVQIKYL